MSAIPDYSSLLGSSTYSADRVTLNAVGDKLRDNSTEIAKLNQTILNLQQQVADLRKEKNAAIDAQYTRFWDKAMETIKTVLPGKFMGPLDAYGQLADEVARLRRTNDNLVGDKRALLDDVKEAQNLADGYLKSATQANKMSAELFDVLGMPGRFVNQIAVEEAVARVKKLKDDNATLQCRKVNTENVIAQYRTDYNRVSTWLTKLIVAAGVYGVNCETAVNTAEARIKDVRQQALDAEGHKNALQKAKEEIAYQKQCKETARTSLDQYVVMHNKTCDRIRVLESVLGMQECVCDECVNIAIDEVKKLIAKQKADSAIKSATNYYKVGTIQSDEVPVLSGWLWRIFFELRVSESITPKTVDDAVTEIRNLRHEVDYKATTIHDLQTQVIKLERANTSSSNLIELQKLRIEAWKESMNKLGACAHIGELDTDDPKHCSDTLAAAFAYDATTIRQKNGEIAGMKTKLEQYEKDARSLYATNNFLRQTMGRFEKAVSDTQIALGIGSQADIVYSAKVAADGLAKYQKSTPDILLAKYIRKMVEQGTFAASNDICSFGNDYAIYTCTADDPQKLLTLDQKVQKLFQTTNLKLE